MDAIPLQEKGTTPSTAASTAATPPPNTAPGALHGKKLSPRAALWILALLAGIAALYFGRLFIVPVLISILASYTLAPVVRLLEKTRLPRPLAALLVLAVLTAGTAWGVLSLRDDAQRMLDSLPQKARQVRQSLAASARVGPNPLQQLRKAADELQRAAAEASGTNNGNQANQANQPPPFADLRDYALKQSGNVLVAVAAEGPVVVILTFFLLASGDHFRRKLMSVAGPSLSRRKITLDILNEIDTQVQRYMLSMVASNIAAGLGIWAAFGLFGLQNAGLWGTAAGILHFIPYLGPAMVTVAATGAAFLQFGSLAQALGVAASSLTVFVVTGMLLMPWMQSRLSRINATVMFVALLFFGWLWGVWGLLLGAPLAAVAKVICERVEPLRHVGEMMGD